MNEPADPLALLGQLEALFDRQLALLAGGDLDAAAQLTPRAQELVRALHGAGEVPPGGHEALQRVRAAHQKVILALRQQQTEAASQMSRCRHGRTAISAYGGLSAGPGR